MDAVKGERRKAAAAAAADGAQRRPLVPSEEKNAAAAPAGRRREVPSRFKPVAPPAAAAARRCTSPSPGRASAVDGSATCNRARSADRARPAAPSSAAPSSRLKQPSTLAAARSSSPARDAATEAHGMPPRARNAKASNGLWVSARSSSPSVRPEPVPAAAPAKKIHRLVHGLPSELTKVQSGAAAERKRSPLRRRTNNIGDQCENARPSEPPANRVTEQHRWPGMMTARGSAGLTSTSAAPAEKTSRSVSSPNASAGCSPRRMHPSEGTGKCLKLPSNEMAKIVHRRRKDKADSSSDTSSQTSESSKSTCLPSKAISSPVPVLHRLSSPRQGLSAAASSTSRSCQSPSRTRPSAPCQSKCAPSSAQSGVEQPVFGYIVDVRKGKKNAGQIENIHQLRLLNNRYLQWRFVNAHSEDTLSQKNGVENILYSVWKSILTLRDALTTTRINGQRLQQEQNLYSILTEQIGYLEQWPVLEEESACTVVEAFEALQASTLCLPITSGAKADGVAIRNAISSAVDVMQALSSSIFYMQSKVRF
ncbi:AUGMIN subunit 8 [Dichanthelium oligosanthes]|uniref:AUGMIN subunit 8 n=1 Tax=Dichanthelium oligosanthes TaxID=888268 RepID=A0A1E5W805_9POAL|nr:AUGMIN subunit 8 [Dichanthelium oligosanthes]